MNYKKTAILSVMFASILGIGVSSVAYAESVTSSVTIGTTCGISFVPSGSTISYGQILPGDTTAEQTFTVVNPGNVAANIKVSGTNWLDGSNANQMNANNTKYSLTTGSYDAKTSLSSTATSVIPSLAPQTNTNTFWQLEANLLSTTFSGALTQTLDFSSSC